MGLLKTQDPNFNRFCMNHPCDGQTDGIAIAYAHLAYNYAVARKNTGKPFGGRGSAPDPAGGAYSVPPDA